MKITPLDIRRKEFKRSVRGYLDEEVDIFLDTVADEVERVLKLNAELEQKVRVLEEQVANHAHMSEALEQTLVAAQLQSEEMRANAERESQSMLREAEARAKGMVEDFYGKTQAVQQSLAQLKSLEEDFRSKFRGMLQGYMKSLEENPAVVSLPDAQGVTPVVSGDQDPGAATVAAPPSLPATGVAQGVPAGSQEDQTVELRPTPAEEPQTASTDETTQAGAQQKEGSVYFGHKDEDLDDPFPEIGGSTAKPRDFAW